MGEQLYLPNKEFIALPVFKFMGCWTLETIASPNLRKQQHSSMASHICGFLGEAEETCAACSFGIAGWGPNLAVGLSKERLEFGGRLVIVNTPREDLWSETAPVSILNADTIDTFPLGQHRSHGQETTWYVKAPQLGRLDVCQHSHCPLCQCLPSSVPLVAIFRVFSLDHLLY